MKKRFAVLLTILMIILMLPQTALAGETEDGVARQTPAIEKPADENSSDENLAKDADPVDDDPVDAEIVASLEAADGAREELQTLAEAGVVSPLASTEKFEITINSGNDANFILPTSGYLNSTVADNDNINGTIPVNTYHWDINWGDGGAVENVTGASGLGGGILHDYSVKGAADTSYTITITPADSDDAWLGAFGFGHNNTDYANATANKAKITGVLSPITLLMTRTAAQIVSGSAPSHEWAYTFSGCSNLTMGSAFTFDQTAWNGVTTAGNGFAAYMFNQVSGSAFTMNSVFNLPKDLTTVGGWFADSMFYGCSGDAFTMNSVFNLPQGITTATGNGFASSMFSICSGAIFNMNAGFNLPQGLTGSVGDFFAASMFDGCRGTAFIMNTGFQLPPGITAVGDYFATQMFQDCNGAVFNMNADFNLPQSITTVGSGFASLMFYNCHTPVFSMNGVFNLPQGISAVGDYFAESMFRGAGGDVFQINSVFKFPKLAAGVMGNKMGVFRSSFATLYSATPLQTRSILSIINNNELPPEQHYTFSKYASSVASTQPPSSQGAILSDWAIRPYNWGCGGPAIFQIKVNSGGDASFILPTSSVLNSAATPYDWYIDWGDGSPVEHETGTAGANKGIPHNYGVNGTADTPYTITITPANTLVAWLGAFGFEMAFYSSGANALANKAKVTGVLSPITPQMTRTTAQIMTSAAPAPTYEWAYTFNDCTNLTMGPSFTFDQAAWNAVPDVGPITKAGDYFAYHMFNFIPGDGFTMNEIFNLPQGITTVGDHFAELMFGDCNGDAFTMNSIFNLPQTIATAGSYFAASMFYNCYGPAFTMNAVFNLPKNIAGTVKDNFAGCIFFGCSGNAFTMNAVFNLPQGIKAVGIEFADRMFNQSGGRNFQVNQIFKFPKLSQSEVDKQNVFRGTFSQLRATMPLQTRDILSILNGNPTPSVQRYTFSASLGSVTNSITEYGRASVANFADWPIRPLNWGCGDLLPWTINFIAGPGGSLSGTVSYPSVVPGATWSASRITVPAPAPASHYVFTGWTAAIPAGDAIINASATYTANFTLDSHTVTYAGNANTGGTVPETMTQIHGSNVTVPSQGTLVRDDYTFTGWNTAADGSGIYYAEGYAFSLTDNIMLYAQWRENGGGTPPPEPPRPPVTPEPKPPLPPVTPDPELPEPPVPPLVPEEEIAEPPEPETPGPDPATGTVESQQRTLSPEARQTFSQEDQTKMEAQTGNIFRDLANGNVPRGNFLGKGAWSLLSLIFSLCAILLSILLFGGVAAARRKRNGIEMFEQTEEERANRKTTGVFGALAILAGILTLIVWLLVDDPTLPIVWINERTTLIAAVFAVHLVLCFVYKTRNEKENDDNIEADNNLMAV